MQYKKTVRQELENIAILNQEEFQSRSWTTAHLRLGEVQVRRTFLVAFTIQWVP
jgi:hypothetical protein